MNPQTHITLDIPQLENIGAADTRLMERVLITSLITPCAMRSSGCVSACGLTAPSAICRLKMMVRAFRRMNASGYSSLLYGSIPAANRATGGCGLGLAIVHSIAQALQGQVSIESSPLGGACVRFCWPVDLPLRDVTPRLPS